MSRNILTVTKWFPPEIQEYEDTFKSCRELKNTSTFLLQRLCVLVDNLKRKFHAKVHHNFLQNELNIEEIEDLTSTMDTISNEFNSILLKLTSNKNHSLILIEKINLWIELLCRIKLKITYYILELVNEIAPLFIYYGQEILILTLKISDSCNNLIALESKFNLAKSSGICTNTCPYLLYPMRKISVTRLLQIIAMSRAELFCHKLIDCLLETYKQFENSDDDNSSDNSSIEIYKALTKHMSPPDNNVEITNNRVKDLNNEGDNENNSGHFLSIEELINYEEKNVIDLLEAIFKTTPIMLGNDGIKQTKTGQKKISAKARDKVLNYYEEILWGEVGNFLEHIVLWWGSSPLSARPPHSSQHLREWITQFIPNAEIPCMVLSALSSLADALGVHVTLTSWDHNFRLALVASKTSNPDTGKLFCTVLHDLVVLSNQCEVTPDWIVGAPLHELPLVEQIPVLHRLDHSIHTTRLWAVNETKKLASNWNVDGFFMVTQSDVVNCLQQLQLLRCNDHTVEIEKGGLGVHVQVCALMRAKLVSEVGVNAAKLKETPNECVKRLAKVCRTISLANLQMIYPENSYWRRNSNEFPDIPSSYVNKYLNQILTPVLEATDDYMISNMILEIMCQAWLDHIYMNKIKFSRYGACQLLCDFSAVETWLMNCAIISQSMRKKMLKNEVLRRCEGVGRLLLRHPGEQIRMVDKSIKINNTSSPSSDKGELMPAEMYVPNQEQWLELRAIKKRNIFKVSMCCGKF